MKREAVWLLGFAATTACARADLPPPTLCQLAENRESYEGQVVTVEGYLLTSRHGSAVTDPTCGYGMAIAFERVSGPRLSAMFDRMETEVWMVRLRVTGRVASMEHPPMGLGPAWELRLTEARLIEAHRLSDADHQRYVSWLEGPSPQPFAPSRERFRRRRAPAPARTGSRSR